MLISGGTGALGLLVACWLRGSCPAVPLVLLGRTGRCSAATPDHLWAALVMGYGQVLVLAPSCRLSACPQTSDICAHSEHLLEHLLILPKCSSDDHCVEQKRGCQCRDEGQIVRMFHH